MIYYKAVWAFLPFGFERKNGMIVLGIDPGYAIVGYGVVEMKNNRYRTLEHGAVTTKRARISTAFGDYLRRHRAGFGAVSPGCDLRGKALFFKQ